MSGSSPELITVRLNKENFQGLQRVKEQGTLNRNRFINCAIAKYLQQYDEPADIEKASVV